MSLPTQNKMWTVQGNRGFDSLILSNSGTVPKFSLNDVLVKFHAVALNYRDISIPKGTFPFGNRDGVVPGSDGAGEVVAVGSKVTRFQVGSKVVTLFNQEHLSGSLTSKTIGTGLGGSIDGALQQYGVFNENGLVAMPETLSWLEAATLPCAALTAWNALFGLRSVKPGDFVLTQGSGGVSMFAIQFAKATGAKVIATTSSPEKAQRLKEIGADYVINYAENPKWGNEAKKLTGHREGVDYVIEIGGPKTMAQSISAIRIDGIVNVIGWLGTTKEKEPGFLECVSKIFTARGLFVGSRNMFEEMNAAIDANNIKPIIDQHVFKFDEVKEAYQYMWDQKNVGKVCIEV